MLLYFTIALTRLAKIWIIKSTVSIIEKLATTYMETKYHLGKRLLSLDKGPKAVLLISLKRRLSSIQKILKHLDPELGKYVKMKKNITCLKPFYRASFDEGVDRVCTFK